MPRKHLFPLVVLLAAATMAGLLALTRTLDLGQPARASAGSDPSISFRLQQLDRLERSLRRQLAQADAASGGAPQTVYRREAPPTSGAATDSDEHESGHGEGDDGDHEGRDD